MLTQAQSGERKSLPATHAAVTRAAASHPAQRAATRSTRAAPPARRGRPTAPACAAAAPPSPTAPPARAVRLCREQARLDMASRCGPSGAQAADWPRLTVGQPVLGAASEASILARVRPPAWRHHSGGTLTWAVTFQHRSPPRSSAISLTYCARDGSRARVRAAACRKVRVGVKVRG